MAHFMCVQCGVQFAESDAPPSSCPICSDPRQYLRLAGQAWTTMDELGLDHDVVLRDEDGVLSIGVEPAFGIGQRALLAETPDGNVLWDCVPLVTDEAVAALDARGKVKAIAISHPHFHSAIVEWSKALGDIPIYIHAGNREWVTRPDSAVVFWEEEAKKILPDLTLIHCGGHFEGSSVCHWKRRSQPGVLLAGDTVQVVMDRKHVSFMYSYPNLWPLNARAVKRIARALEPFDYERVYSAFWHMRILEDGKGAVARSVDRYLKAIAD
jgi:glyoxylase-like metal-dependent hydrolase (beta-lactamase superfamily II)